MCRDSWFVRDGQRCFTGCAAGIGLVVTVLDGLTKPYMDGRGVILVKDGANKQPASSREGLQRLFQQSGLIQSDETPVHGLGVGDVDLTCSGTFLREQFGETPTEQRP